MTTLFQGDRPEGRDEIIAALLFRERVSRIAVSLDSRVPDSFGDQMFCASLKMAYEARNFDLPMRETVILVEGLLDRYMAGER